MLRLARLLSTVYLEVPTMLLAIIVSRGPTFYREGNERSRSTEQQPQL